MIRPPPTTTLFPYTTLFRSDYIMLAMINPNATRIPDAHYIWEAKYNGARITSSSPDFNPSAIHTDLWMPINQGSDPFLADRKSTRLNSSHVRISYAVFCLKK